MGDANSSESSTSGLRPSLFGRAIVLLIVLGSFALAFSPVPGKVKRGVKELMDHWKEEKIVVEAMPVIEETVVVKEVPVVEERVIEKEVPVVQEKIVYRDIEADPDAPPPPLLPPSFVPNKTVEVKEMFNDIQVLTQVTTNKGKLPSKERKSKTSYQARFDVKVNLPEANDSIAELSTVNRRLPSMLPGLTAMLPKAKVSGFFQQLYDRKVKHLQSRLTNLEKALSKHNFYDCETILEMTHPTSNQKVLLIQADMDVVADGTDGDRMASFDASLLKSTSFQPATSYRWPKRTSRPNPLLSRYVSGLQRAKDHLKVAGFSEKRRMEYLMKTYPSIIEGMKKESYLIGTEDPFIVISLATRPYIDSHPYTPRIGDYAVVIYNNKLYPAICGDYGPDTKVGEASLRLAKELNPKATPTYRPVSDLAVTYLIFPNSRDIPAGPPNLAQWHQRCSSFLQRIGGLGQGYHLHQWQDRLTRPAAANSATAQRWPERTPRAQGSLNLPSTPLPSKDPDGRLSR